MGIGVSLLLIAIGAVLTFAVEKQASGIDIDVVGWILMGVGAVGFLLSLLFWQSWGWGGGPRGYWGRRRTTYVEDAPPPPPEY